MSKSKKCPSCGKMFLCDGENDCWCENIQLHKREFLILNEKFTDCICKDCLSEYTEK